MTKLSSAVCLFAAIAFGADPTLLILHKGASSLGFYTTSGEMQSAAAVGEHPHEIAISADGRYAFTTNNGTMRIENPGSGGNTISIVDLAARKTVGEISLGNFRRPHGIALDAAGKRLVVTTEMPDRLLLVDVASRKVIRDFDTRGKTSHMVTLGPGSVWAYVSNSTSASVSAVNLQTGAVVVIPCGERPEGSVLSKDGRHLFVTNREAKSIAIIDTKTNQAVGTIATGNGPVRIGRTPDGKSLVYAVMHDHAVEFADPVTRKVTGRVPLPSKSGIISLEVSPDGQYATAAAEEDDTVFVVSISDRKLVRTIKVTEGFAPDPAVWLSH